MPHLVIAPESPDSPDARRLIAQLDAHLLSLYPPEGVHTLDFSALDERGALLLARLDGAAVGCAALRPLDGENAELKRVYVDPSARGHGVGRALVLAVEELARERGFQVMQLETGVELAASVRLYESLGYGRIPPFGDYVSDPASVCYGKRL